MANPAVLRGNVQRVKTAPAVKTVQRMAVHAVYVNKKRSEIKFQTLSIF